VRTRRITPTARTVIFCVMGVASGLAMVITLVVTVRGTNAVARENAARTVPAQTALRETWAASAAGQESLLAFLQTQDPAARAAALTAAQASGQAQNAAWSAYLKHALGRPGERALQQSYETASTESVQLAASLLGTTPTDPTFATKLAGERRASAKLIAALASLESEIYDPTMRSNATTIVSGINDARNVEYLTYALLALVFSATGVVLGRSAHRDEQRMQSDATAMKAAARFAQLDTSLQRALDMERTEEAAYGVIEQALTLIAPGVPSELLLADSSHAHFRQVFSIDPDADAACRVAAPEECPATMSGQTQVFEDSSHLDTCPYLRGRDDAVWAVCVPLSIAGRTTGVIHAQRSVGLPPGDATRAWELVGRKAGERIGMLRAFTRSETQAQTDPLTGLLNRRSLEDRVRDLGDGGIPFVIAYGDLDQFKLLNDVHGHDTGDRALRLFARVLRDSVRPNDIPARYGGEEFVTVLPDCSLDNAIAVIERIRAQLRAALTNGTLPPFTVSFGIAASETGITFRQTLDAADTALLRAKRTGRDRVVVDGAELPDDETATTPGPQSTHLRSHQGTAAPFRSEVIQEAPPDQNA
jgi:diguanylate cyclase (GGDEF)-like protein